MKEWAKRELNILCNSQKDDDDPMGYGYIRACCDSALKAYESLLDDDHSGFSIGITMNILNSLVSGKALTPIEDTEDVWNECSYIPRDSDIVKQYQCKRMSSLFKEIHKDGSVKYHDNNRIECYDVDHPSATYHSSFINRVVGEMFPLTMPYKPTKPYVVCVETLLTDPKNGDFDTKGILSITTPEGNIIDINRYYKESDDGFVEIGHAEYLERKELHNKRVAELERLRELNGESEE